MPPRTAEKVKHLTPADLAERLGMSEGHLANWRHQGKGPAYIRGDSAGRKALILYRLVDVEAWEERQLVVPATA
jgi:hypothetical protein